MSKLKYEQIKESIKNIKSRDELSENSNNIKKIVKMHRFKKLYFFVLCI